MTQVKVTRDPTRESSAHYIGGMPPATPAEEFAALMRKTREDLGWSRETLAIECDQDISASTIKRMEAGSPASLALDNVRNVSRALGIEPRRFLVALGHIDPAPPEGDAIPAEIAEVLRILRSDVVPAAEKAAWVDYLRFLDRKHRGDDAGRAAV